MIGTFLGRLLALVAMIATLVAPGTVGAQLADTPWPMFHRDVRHTGRGDVEGPSSVNLKWVFQAGYALRNSPAIGPDGTVYVASGRTFFALDPDGETVDGVLADSAVTWSVKLPGTSFRIASPTVGENAMGDRTIYVGGRDNALHAFDAGANGMLLWAYYVGTDGDVLTAPAVAPNGNIFFGGFRRLHAVTAGGSLVWLKALERPMQAASPALDLGNGTLYTATLGGVVYAFNMNDGAQIWQLAVSSNIKYSSPVIADDGTIYIGTRDGLSAINPNGSLKWTLDLGAGSRGIISTPAVAADGRIYVGTKGGAGSSSGRFLALNPANGNIIWDYVTGEFFRGGAVLGKVELDGDYTIYTTSGRRVLALRNDGSFLWEYETGGNIHASPVLGGDGTLYVSSSDRHLYAFEK